MLQLSWWAQMDWIEELTSFAHGQLEDAELEVLWGRGVSDEQIALYRIGVMRGVLPPMDGADRFLEWSANGSRLVDMFCLPMTNTRNQVRGLQFRYVNREKKGYKNYVIEDGDPALFGLGQAMPHVWDTGCIAIVEGAFDLFPLQRWQPGVIATMTAMVSSDLVRILRRTATEVWTVYDSDKQGVKGAHDFQKEHGDAFRVRDIQMPKVRKVTGEQSKDPSDVWEVFGDAKFQNLLESLGLPRKTV